MKILITICFHFYFKLVFNTINSLNFLVPRKYVLPKRHVFCKVYLLYLQ